MSDREALRAAMDRFIHEIWEDQRLDVLSEVVKEDATFYFGGDILIGIEAIREFPIRSQRIFCALNRVSPSCFVFRALAEEKQDVFLLLEKLFGALAREDLLGFNPLHRKY